MKWVNRFCRALMMGLAWGALWVPVGLVGARMTVGELDPEHIGGPLYAGFLCGSVFSAFAGIASGRRRLGELSFLRAGAWGAVSGVLVGALPFVLGEDQHGSDRPLWVLPVVVTSAMTLIASVSAVVSAWLGRVLRETPVKGVRIES